MPSHNPYNTASSAGSEIFVGRIKIKQQLISGLQKNLNYSLTGDPGIGKTSLLQSVHEELVATQDDVQSGQIPLPVYIDFGYNQNSLEKVLVHIYQSVAKALISQRHLPQSPDDWHAEATQGRLNSALQKLLNWAFDHEKIAHQPILLLDDFHRLSDKSLRFELMSILQAAINLQELKLALLLSGQHALTGELRDDISPLRLLITRNYKLDRLTCEETRQLVSIGSKYGWRIETGCGDLAFKLTRGHPYRLHYYLYAILADEGRLTCENLNAFHTSETRTYLDTLLYDGTTESQPTTIPTPAIDTEIVNRIRELVRDDKIENALDELSAVNLWQQDADLLTQRLSHINGQAIKGLLKRDSINPGRTLIAHDILKLIYSG